MIKLEPRIGVYLKLVLCIKRVMLNKFYNQTNLAKKIKNLKNKKIVLCHGVFDLVHLGHIKHFEEAKSKGDVLVVSVTSDRYVEKGPGRPFFSEKQRIQFLSSLKLVDFLLLSDSKNANHSIKIIKPNIYCKGPDYKDNKKDIGQIKLKKQLKKIGKIYYGDITFNSGTNKSSRFFTHIQKKIFLKFKK